MPVGKIAELVDGKVLFSTECDATVAEICGELRERKIGALAVLDDGRLTGIVSERDVITKVVACGRDPKSTRVVEIMTAKPVTIDVDETVATALERMKGGGFRHLPVMDDGEAVGMVSMRDIPINNQFLYERFASGRLADNAPVVDLSHRQEVHDMPPFPVALSLVHLTSAS